MHNKLYLIKPYLTRIVIDIQRASYPSEQLLTQDMQKVFRLHQPACEAVRESNISRLAPSLGSRHFEDEKHYGNQDKTLSSRWDNSIDGGRAEI